MIDLRTGVPGSGKTLSAVEALAKMLARWEKHPDEARPIFVHGVTDLALSHSPVPTITVQQERGKPALLVPDWAAMPDGSYVLIDEAQTFFPPRGSASTPPEHVAWLNTHRHRGFDITVITQHPKLIDGSLRALVGKHQHYRRLFGGQRAAVYEWDACSDNLSGLANAVTSYYPYPKKTFGWYKSAEIHTKQSFRLPRWIVIPFIGVAIGAFAFPRAYSALSNGIAGRGLSSPTTAASSPKAPGAVAPGAPGLAAGVSAVGGPVAAIPEPAKIVGCMATATRCLCVDGGGVVAKVADTDCRLASRELGGLVPYDTSAVRVWHAAPGSMESQAARVPRQTFPP